MEQREKCLCAFCKLERPINRKKHISLVNVFLSAVFSLFLTFGIWLSFDPRGLIFFSIFVMTSEIVIQIKWRLTLPCPFCGFDPVLYLRKPELVAEKVKIKLEAAKISTQLLSKNNPWTKLSEIAKKNNKINRRPKVENLSLQLPVNMDNKTSNNLNF